MKGGGLPHEGVGGLPHEGAAAKKLVWSFEAQENEIFGGMSQDFCRDIPGVPEKLRKICLCSIVAPYLRLSLNQEFSGTTVT